MIHSLNGCKNHGDDDDGGRSSDWHCVFAKEEGHAADSLFYLSSLHPFNTEVLEQVLLPLLSSFPFHFVSSSHQPTSTIPTFCFSISSIRCCTNSSGIPIGSFCAERSKFHSFSVKGAAFAAKNGIKVT